MGACDDGRERRSGTRRGVVTRLETTTCRRKNHYGLPTGASGGSAPNVTRDSPKLFRRATTKRGRGKMRVLPLTYVPTVSRPRARAAAPRRASCVASTTSSPVDSRHEGEDTTEAFRVAEVASRRVAPSGDARSARGGEAHSHARPRQHVDERIDAEAMQPTP